MTKNIKTPLSPDFKGKRTTKIIIRSLHILTIAGTAGGIFFGLPFDNWAWFWYAAITTGSALFLLDALSNLIWFVQIRGIIIMLKIGLLLLVGIAPNWDTLIMVVAIIASGIISHAPSNWRYYSIWHRRIIRSSKDSKG
ncbi:multipass membrane protein [Oleiphilus messinensis]|uniref:Multipass membrane protein n=1 Tax=Oleiphilus messinensis TaxID=141451 RepID=A0A1Y0I4N2_9GAMM|nr:hypothetical protein [Oleiphilus messinensis]ARU54746.1 multipass membrane protein [Oleiphilus messinensis]